MASKLQKKVAKLDFCTKTQIPEPIYFDYRHDFIWEQESEKKEKERERKRLYRLKKKVAKLDFCTKTQIPEPMYFDYRHNFIWTQPPIKKECGPRKLKEFMLYDISEYIDNDRAVY